ncbi:DUF6875 domain-containing protein [Bradyrhizobium iriomotense]|uniref:DUF6875 domain-containing protein n=1 Tax=Bradyrhizobium iriomotense TaxID=441950 RepID=A0ABQ6ASB2_9BRAD|nr:hypothetical protein [Bradyrhizobium iriomotense]GLR84091.1 hypothetical protein GCM10007857_08010 [Bradyrhizobium iriomotense]
MDGSHSLAQAANLFLFEDLEDGGRASTLAKGELTALRAVAEWIRGFVAKPHKDLGRAGPVCPFVPVACERRTLWLAPEETAGRSVSDVVDVLNGYRMLLQDPRPLDGKEPNYKSIVIAFPDLPTDRAKAFLDGVLRELGVPSYVNDGLVLGGFYETNEGPAIYNPGFRPFTPPVPFLLMRHAVISDWKFFLDSEDWLGHWARRYPVSGIHALAEELRSLPWRVSRD